MMLQLSSLEMSANDLVSFVPADRPLAGLMLVVVLWREWFGCALRFFRLRNTRIVAYLVAHPLDTRVRNTAAAES